MSCVMTKSNNVFNHDIPLQDHSFSGTLEEPFDQSFSFLEPDFHLGNYLVSPVPSRRPSPAAEMSHYPPQEPASGSSFQQAQPRHEGSPAGMGQLEQSHGQEGDMANMGQHTEEHENTPFDMSHFSANLHSPHVEQTHEVQNAFNPYAPYSMGFGESPSGRHPYRHHPYWNQGFRSPRSSRPPPLSPALSLSPSTSHPHSHHATPPQAISPNSVMSSDLSNISPSTSLWTSSHPPSMHPGYPVYAGTPITSLTSVHNVSPPMGMGMGMVGGFPYPMAKERTPAQGSGSKQPRAGKRGKGQQEVKREKEEDEDLDSEMEEDAPGQGLGFNPSAEDIEGRITVPPKPQDIRTARIQSEQRRRDELREGFKRLKEALPPSNLRASKSNLLDRSVAYIQQIDAANHYLMGELEKAQKENAELRKTNQDLIHALSLNTRASSGSNASPASSADQGRA